MNTLSSDILIKIFSNLNFGTIVRVCRQWRDIAERNKKKIRELSVDLAKVEDSNVLNDFAPLILNVTCSLFKLPNNKFKNIYIIYKDVVNNADKYNEDDRLIKIFKTIARLQKIEKIDIMKIKLFLIYTNHEINYLIYKKRKNFSISDIIVSELLKIKIQFYMKKIEVNIKELFLIFFKDNITRIIKYFKLTIIITFILINKILF